MGLTRHVSTRFDQTVKYEFFFFFFYQTKLFKKHLEDTEGRTKESNPFNMRSGMGFGPLKT